ncbi:D12 class N6 adenine-specific DNA methyltransferase [Gaiella occulta]|uniref:site-specific DNA-methyltransferase (adenine-specific) n=1 Tax=Gaiella occulta TaxID=1002870 RepID=A0A7M2YTU8_9ACTN|nr:DNA adenine methylase [Gaiella occulta]RDI73513.1 D12 class N6 adenine-specific DNA methyltransferase [Gaiella occulta]
MAVAADQRYPSPLRYPGGKGKIANYIKLVILDNDLVGCEYVEPYAGGASIALSLLFEEYADRIHINDINRGVFAFWDTALRNPDELCRRIQSVPLDVTEWLRQRAIQRDPNADPVDLGFATFYLNRTSRSGIIGGGVIGGLDQSGHWKIDARFNRGQLIRRLQRIGRFASRITLTSHDAAQYLTEVLPGLERPFVYLDPPYYTNGAKLYENWYAADDHAAIAATVRRLGVPWIVSYDAVPEVAELYTSFARIGYELHYSAAIGNLSGSELMFFSPGLVAPSVASPAGVRSKVVDQARLAG